MRLFIKYKPESYIPLTKLIKFYIKIYEHSTLKTKVKNTLNSKNKEM